MKKVGLVLVVLLTIYGLVVFSDNNSTINTDIAIPTDNSGKMRAVESIQVKNYNITGKEIIYYDKVPQRVIAVGENIIETLVALGAEKNILVAAGYKTKYYVPQNIYAERYNALTIQSTLTLNPETVIAMQPDLIVSGQQLFSEKNLRNTSFWQQRGVNTFLSANANSPFSSKHQESLTQETDFILGLSMIFEAQDKAQVIVDEIYQEIANVRSKTQGRQPVKVMIIEQLSGKVVTYDANKLAGDICSRLGAVVPYTHSVIGWENLLAENPDVLFVVKSGGDPEIAADKVRMMPALQNLNCIKNNRVYGISLIYTYNTAIKTIEGIRKFAAGIYPDLYSDSVL